MTEKFLAGFFPSFVLVQYKILSPPTSHASLSHQLLHCLLRHLPYFYLRMSAFSIQDAENLVTGVHYQLKDKRPNFQSCPSGFQSISQAHALSPQSLRKFCQLLFSLLSELLFSGEILSHLFCKAKNSFVLSPKLPNDVFMCCVVFPLQSFSFA